MTSSPISSIEEINTVLQSQNPFVQPPYVGSEEIWGKEFPDVKSLNVHASDAVFQALAQIRAGQYPRTSIAITAESGTGKTHIISRIRHRLQSEGGALFIYVSEVGDLNKIKSGFQRTLADSLGYVGSQEVIQWQELAAAIANQALKTINSSARTFSPKQLVEKFSVNDLVKNRNWVNKLTETFRQTKSNLKNPDIVRAILWTLSNAESLYAIKWLSGDELASYKANELYLPSVSGQPFDAILQILDLIGDYNQLVICFDELDLPEVSDAGFTKAQVIAGLVKELFESLKRGVILSVMMPATWSNKIKQLPAGVYGKVSAQGNPIDLKYMDGDSIVELVATWLKDFYEIRNFVPPNPVYPFTENQLRELSSEEKPPVRKVLQWCKENCQPPTVPLAGEDKGRDKPVIVIIEDPVELVYKKELEKDRGNYLDENFLLADALLFGFETLIGQTVERVTIEKVTDKVKKRGGKDPHINVKVIGTENGQDVSIGVAVLQQAGGKALGAGLKKIMDYETFSVTRGCLVRSKSKDKQISQHLHNKYLLPLISKGGEFVELKEEDIKPLVAIRAVHKKHKVEYELSEQQIFNFIAEKGAENKLGASNPLLQEILSDPSYQVPDDVIEEDLSLLDEASEPDSPDSTDMSDLVMVD